ncbi:hypothetical protein BU16DRAFT_81017 [Lophium mytilinum]|uniref:Uncharacterized protein n=1 Tax=Lophium mytilinum TaxID=390894 RepID=A0A6A6QMI7_9PEZI|nr:hypothetical protein BU16DRAFT_81017 [Lophium mytilinum]
MHLETLRGPAEVNFRLFNWTPAGPRVECSSDGGAWLIDPLLYSRTRFIRSNARGLGAGGALVDPARAR